ncbi:hypothetical protein JKP88DRAFT_225545 [Tribonema minus]|uniref:Uncharacterized protein n=1 Tax=Tribonema minus TaxID=303371 RepID=A0A836CAJ6_9STRA|nr:hypothetical protein JKP88DRAFT_225545 [Tribonema minus]
MSGGLTVLHICADLGSAAAVDALLATDVGRKCAALRNDAGMRPIDLAAMGRHRALVEKLHPVTTSNSGGGGSGETVEELMAAGLQRHREHVEAAEAQEREAARAEAAALKPTRFPEASTEAKRAAEATKTEGNAAFAAAPPRLAEALAAYTRAVELDANNHVYWSNRSAVHMALGDAAAALADAEVARRLKPDWPKACYRMAIAREALGMWEEAAVSAWEGVQLDNTNAELKKVLQRCVEEGRKAHQAQQLQSPPQQQPPQQQQR